MVGKLRELRENSAHILGAGSFSNSELVFEVHGCIFNINQAIEALTEFLSDCLPLKFVGKLNFDQVQKEDVGSMERLADINFAEILPSKLPKIKLGQLFHLDFRISKRYCEAAKRFITYSVTKDDAQYQKVCAYLQDNKNGSYALSFPITAIIPHTVHIFYLGEHIRNSPYTVVFKVGPNQGPTTTGIGAPGGQAISGFIGNPKDIMGDGMNNSTRVVGRATVDEREAFRRQKWTNQPADNNNGGHQSSNWPMGHMRGASSPEPNHNSDSAL